MSNNPQKKVVKFRVRWIYVLLLVGIVWMMFGEDGANPQKEEWPVIQELWENGST